MPPRGFPIKLWYGISQWPTKYGACEGDGPMLKRFRGYAIAAVLLAAAAFAANAASLPNFGGPAQPNPAMNPTLLGDLNATVGLVNQYANSSTMGSPLNFRNWLDNGAMDVAQRGSAQINCGGTTGT